MARFKQTGQSRRIVGKSRTGSSGRVAEGLQGSRPPRRRRRMRPGTCNVATC